MSKDFGTTQKRYKLRHGWLYAIMGGVPTPVTYGSGVFHLKTKFLKIANINKIIGYINSKKLIK